MAESKGFFYFLFFWTAGVSTLFMWNSALSLTGYFNNRIESAIDFQYPFYFSFGSFVAFLLYKFFFKLMSFKVFMLALPCVTSGLFFSVFLIAEYLTKGSLKKYLFLAMITVAGFFNSLLQTRLMGYIFSFTFKEISAFNSGTALAGILTTLVSIANQLFFDSFSPDLTEEERNKAFFIQGVLYMVFNGLVLFFVMFVFTRWIRTKMDVEIKDDSATVSNGSIEDRTILKEEKEQAPGLFEVLLKIPDFFLHMIWIYAVSLSLFPTLTINMGLSEKGLNVGPPLVVLIFNVGDMVGKYIYSHLELKSKPGLFTINLCRIALVGFGAYVFRGSTPDPTLVNKAYITVPLLLILSISNGYLTSGLFSVSAAQVAPAELDANGFWMTLGLLFGITYGTLTTLVGVNSG